MMLLEFSVIWAEIQRLLVKLDSILDDYYYDYYYDFIRNMIIFLAEIYNLGNLLTSIYCNSSIIIIIVIMTPMDAFCCFILYLLQYTYLYIIYVYIYEIIYVSYIVKCAVNITNPTPAWVKNQAEQLTSVITALTTHSLLLN